MADANSFRYQDTAPDQGYDQEEEERDGMIIGSCGNFYYGPSYDFVQIASLKCPVEELFGGEIVIHPLSASIDV